jgi:tRNAThr (cytosine32-N3)-methyltransferase
MQKNNLQSNEKLQSPTLTKVRIFVFSLGGPTTVLPDDLKKHSSSEATAHERNNISNVFRSYLILHFDQPSSVQLSKHSTNSVKDRFNSDPAKWWNNFYKNNTANFFKNRKWLQQEFPVLSKVTQADAGPITLLEVGAGAGNTAFPILANNHNPNLKIHACDFSKKAVDVIRENEAYDTKNIQADVWDAASEVLPPGLEEGSVEVVLMIFIFSALSPSQWKQAVHNIHRLLKPGGEVLFRDYGRGDLAQVRFKKGRYLEENFYIRGDGTRVYFFEKDELIKIWTGNDVDRSDDPPSSTGFEVVDLGVDRRLLVNRAKQLKMYRCWMQGRFRKQEKPQPG